MGDSKALTVAVPFVRVDASQNPNLTVRSKTDPALPYYRAMVVAFASVLKFNPHISLKVVSNCSPPPEVADAFAELGIETVMRSFDHRPPAGFTDKFEASLYLIDALEALRSDDTLLIDPDVLCVGSLSRMFAHVGRNVGAMSIDYERQHPVHGLSREEAGELHGLLGEPHPAPVYYGGEAYFIPIEHSGIIRERAEAAWELSLSRHMAGESKFVTEEHLLSFALRGAPVADIGGSVKRIWTARRFRNVDGTERNLTLWHLPAEKSRGFSLLYAAATNRASWFWSADREDFVQRAGRAMGIHDRTLQRLVADMAGQALNRLL